MAESRIQKLTLAAWLLLLLSALLLLSVGSTRADVDTVPWLLLVGLWSVVITGMLLLTVPAPSGARLTLGIGGVVAASILTADPYALGAAISIALVSAWIIRNTVAVGPVRSAGEYLADVVAIVVYGSVCTVAFTVIDASTALVTTWTVLATVAVAGFAWFLARALVSAYVGREQSDISGRFLWQLALQDWAVAISIIAAGALFGLAWIEMGFWAFPVAIMPYAFAHAAFKRYWETRVTYGQMIQALAQIPEVADLAPIGHSDRTAATARAIAKEMGLNPVDTTELEYAALMHDVGRITLNEPAILRAGYTDEDIARWGAQIIAEAPYLHDVSEIVRLQHRPYRSPGIPFDPDIPMTSKIVKVASAFDQAQIEEGLSQADSLERIHQGSAYEFDPKVAASLRRVLLSRGVVLR